VVPCFAETGDVDDLQLGAAIELLQGVFLTEAITSAKEPEGEAPAAPRSLILPPGGDR
jgi:ribosomal protein L12E/L44/L45/RPP1/RPP2